MEKMFPYDGAEADKEAWFYAYYRDALHDYRSTEEIFESVNKFYEENKMSTSNWRELVLIASLEALRNGGAPGAMLAAIRRASDNLFIAEGQVQRTKLLEFVSKQKDPKSMLHANIDQQVDTADKATTTTQWWGFEYKGRHVEVATPPVNWPVTWFFVMGEEDVGREVMADIFASAKEKPSRAYCFSGSDWYVDEELSKDLGNYSWKNVVLSAQLRKEINTSVVGFRDYGDAFKKLGFPRKRGILLIGPPGTGKSSAIKAIANEMPELPFLCVKDPRETAQEDTIQELFDGARKKSPCILVFEDVDGLLTPHNRSRFLNELDGFRNNDGLFIIASTNYPQRIDEALLKRPSRFDRVIKIGLPEVKERAAYCYMVLSSISGFPTELAKTISADIADESDGFSPAFLKEAILSAVLSLAQSGKSEIDASIGPEIISEVKILKDRLEELNDPEGMAEFKEDNKGIGLHDWNTKK